MKENNKNIVNFLDGAIEPSVQDSNIQISASDELMNDVHVATWHWNRATLKGVWSPEQPNWLPQDALSSAEMFAAYLHPDDRAFFTQAITDESKASFESQVRLMNNDEETWLHINARNDNDQPEIMVLALRDASAIKSLQMTLQQQIRRHQDMVRDTEAIAFEVELPSWTVRHVGRQVEALLGYPAADWLRIKDFLATSVLSEDWPMFQNLSSADDDDNDRFSFEFRIRAANGDIRWVRCAGRQVAAGKHSPMRARGILQDVSASRLAIEAQQVSEKQLNILYDQNPSMFFSMDMDGVILSVNRYGAEHLGYKPAELIGRNALRIHLPSQRTSVKTYLAECLEARGEVRHWETCLVSNDDKPLWVRVAARATDDSSKAGILAVCEDITEARALSDKLEYQTRFDLLTGLANRSSFENSLQEAIESAQENKWDHVLCYLDLDQFKIINDTCGHSAGDQMLIRIGRIIAKYLRENDTLARLGGDEFGILFHRCSLADAEKRAEEINQFLATQRFNWGENKFRLTGSIGIVGISNRTQSIEQLLSIADTACYAAKDAGRNRVYTYTEDDDVEITRRHGEMSWVARLQVALDGDGFEVYSQIIKPLDAAESDKVSIEILLRLKDYSGDVILPERFIRAAENYHIATRLDLWVCEHVVYYFSKHPTQLQNLNFVCVNLSAQSVTDSEFKGQLLSLLQKRRHVAKHLCFEITETGVIENMEAATQFISELKALGCRFALDDFGSGVSSFAYLKSLEVDIVKIDGMFVRHMTNDPVDLALVGSINDIGHVMGKETIAEYVEDADTQRCLRQLGVDYAQGYHIHKPEPLTRQLRAMASSRQKIAH